MSAASLPEVMADTLSDYLGWLRYEHKASPATVDAYGRDLRQFAVWSASTLGRCRWEQVTADDLRAWMLARHDEGVSARTASRQRVSVRRLFDWMLRHGRLDLNPVSDVRAPHVHTPLPVVFGEDFVTELLAAPDVGSAIGLRDRVMLGVMYSAGLRVSEVVALSLAAVSFDPPLLRVLGKGRKERLVPVGEHTAAWIARYLREARPSLDKSGRSEALFLTQRGRIMSRQNAWLRVTHYARSVGAKGKVSPHTLRHCFATHLLAHGADLRVIQEMLGHANVTTTEIYTAVTRERLASIHAATHPRARRGLADQGGSA